MASKKKTYGTARSGRTIDDDLVDERVEKAERGCDVDERDQESTSAVIRKALRGYLRAS